MVFIVSALLLSQTEKITHSYLHGKHVMGTDHEEGEKKEEH